MTKRSMWTRAAGLLSVLGACCSVQAQTIPDEYGKLVVATSQVKGLGSGLAGEEVNLYSGQLGLTQTDVSLPGNSALPVEVTRRFNAAHGSDAGSGYFEDWDLALPSIHGVFSKKDGWVANQQEALKYQRCTQFSPPPTATGQVDGYFDPGEFWHGTFVFLPGRGDQELLRRHPATAVPADGKSYRLVLADGSAVSCLASLASGSDPSNGEGFEVVTGDGTRYRFDHMVTRSHASLAKSSPAPQGMMMPLIYNGYLLYRVEYWLYPTTVTDRFGNTITYTWSPSNPRQLKSIVSSDGRAVSFTYTDADGYRIQSVASSGRTWTYSYGTGTLTQVKLPDQRSWKFELWDLGIRTAGSGNPIHSYACDGTSWSGNTSTGSVTHPSGAVVAFSLKVVKMPRTWVPRECMEVEAYSYYPKDFNAMALVSKTITGPGLPAGGYTWAYGYDDTEGCWNPNSVPSNRPNAPKCTGATAGVRTATVTNPDGSVDQFVYGNRYMVDEGKLLMQRTDVAGSGELMEERRSYALPDAGPYPPYIGYSSQSRGDGELASRHTPLSKQVIQQAGFTSSWSATFDAHARPLTVTRSGTSSAP